MASCSGHPLLFRPKFCFLTLKLTGCGAFVQGSSLVSHRNWSTEESQKSSTWRELAALKFALAAFQGHLSGLRVRCNTDNQYVVRIIQIGSIIKELQENAWGIILFTSRSQIQLDMSPRSKFSGNFFSAR